MIQEGDIILVTVSDEATTFSKQYLHSDWYELVIDNDDWYDPIYERIKGDFTIVGLAKDLSGTEWRKLVKGYGKMYMDYTSTLNGLAAHCLTDIESGHSLLAKYGLNETTTLILKKIT